MYSMHPQCRPTYHIKDLLLVELRIPSTIRSACPGYYTSTYGIMPSVSISHITMPKLHTSPALLYLPARKAW